MAGRGLAGAAAGSLWARPGFGQGVGTVGCASGPPRGGSPQTARLQPVVSREKQRGRGRDGSCRPRFPESRWRLCEKQRLWVVGISTGAVN